MRLVIALLSSACFGATPLFVLPDDVIPKKHSIDMTIDPSKDSFTGSVRIDVDVKKATSILWVNAKDIVPKEASVGSHPARATAVGGEFISLELDTPIAAGHTTISIRYEGKLDEKAIVGPYRKKVGDDWYVFTSFTPIDARRAFPCFDEPRFKTPWAMTIHVKRRDKAFANGRELREVEEANGMKAAHFATTEPLPAEVVAFTVGPLEYFEGAKAGHGTPIRVVTPKDHASEGKTAAQATVDVLPRLESYTGIPYPFGKLDHLADPEFPFGATENPGLIVYRMRALLATPEEDTPEKARAIRRLQAHEIGHQWFGDMVTQATWDDVWLSEGFATWFAAKVMDEEQPPARKNLALVASRDRIMNTDDSPRTRPVRRAMNSRDDTKDVYSQIVYQKGGALLMMLDGWLGEDKVRTGIRAYLKAHKFGNATTAELESALRTAVGLDPTTVMDAFLNQTGVPKISGELRCDEVEIHKTGPGPLPVCVRGDGVQHTCQVIDSDRATVALKHGASCPSWIYLNSGATGYYRTEWTASQLNTLALSQLTPAERLMLAYDLRLATPRADVTPLLMKLSSDPEPEIAKAAGDVIQGK